MTIAELKAFFKSLSEQNYNIHPLYIKITGRINYGFLLTQLLFLARHHDYQPFYKSDEYMKEFYGFTEWEIREGRRELIKLGIFTTEKRSDGHLWYDLNLEKLIQLILEVSPASVGFLHTPPEVSYTPLCRIPTLAPINNDQSNNDLTTTTTRVVELELFMRNGERVSKQKIDYWFEVLEEKKVVNINNILAGLWKKCLTEAKTSEIGLMNTFVEKHAPAKDLGPSYTVPDVGTTLASMKKSNPSEIHSESYKNFKENVRLLPRKDCK